MTEPPPASSRWGMPYLQQRKTDFRLMSWTRCQVSTEVSRAEASSLGLIPALLKSTSIRPISCAACSYMSRTDCSSETSARRVSSPSAPSAMSTPTTRAPSSANNRAVSAPMPLAAPVITQTFPSRRPAIRRPPECVGSPSALRRVVDVLDLAVGLERVGTELAADPGLLEAAERGRDADRGVRVDRDHAGLERPRHAQRLCPVPGPDGAREPVDRVVGDRDRLGLVIERDHTGDWAEDLLAGRAGVVRDRSEDGRREPVAGAARRGAPEGDRRVAVHIGGDGL